MKNSSFLIGQLMAGLSLVLILAGCTHDSLSVQNEESIQYVELPTAHIAYKTLGKGEPLLLCTGFSATMEIWATPMIERLQEQYQLILFDYRGMGYSTNSDTAFSIQTLAEDVFELCEHLDIKKADILGWSMGGYVAQMFALKHPELVSRLILYASDGGDTTVIDPDQRILDMLVDTASGPQGLLGTLFTPRWLETHSDPWQYFPKPQNGFDSETIMLQNKAITKWMESGGGSVGRLHELKMETLIITGDDDAVTPYQNSELLADSIQNSTLIKINNGGHGVMYQFPDLVADYILAFLNHRQE